MKLCSESEMDEIWSAVRRGGGNHSSFVVSFATTYMYADPCNRRVLHDASNYLIGHYGLAKQATVDYLTKRSRADESACLVVGCAGQRVKGSEYCSIHQRAL